APSSFSSKALPIHMQVIPNATIIIPATKRGLKSILELVEEFISAPDQDRHDYINIICLDVSRRV
ncbi:MAG TPA: hypothetical protein VGW09_03860, partial [Nitrososphaeraceae archaeon]|nr:hypothetical protein [Nitrososphaeraceae archaeon]